MFNCVREGCVLRCLDEDYVIHCVQKSLCSTVCKTIPLFARMYVLLCILH